MATTPSCAACKMLRRRCGEKCVLAPYFPSSDIHKFVTAHKVFGASNIIKLLQDMPCENRADAVSSMVYEAMARTKDPVYGCAGIVSHMQSHISSLQSQLTAAHAEILLIRLQITNLLTLHPQKCVDQSLVNCESEGSEKSEHDHGFGFELNSSRELDDDPLLLWEAYFSKQ